MRILAEVDAHQCGVNNVLVETLPNSDLQTSNKICNRNLLISASDDQTIHICYFDITEEEERRVVFVNHISVSRLACNTGITGLQYFGGLIFSCGSDQRLNVWEIVKNDEKLSLKFKTGIFIEVPDVSSLLVVPQEENQFLCFITGYLAMQTIKLIKC